MLVYVGEDHFTKSDRNGKLVVRGHMSHDVFNYAYHGDLVAYVGSHECQLEEECFGNRKLACRIPADFVAHLCAVI